MKKITEQRRIDFGYDKLSEEDKDIIDWFTK
jgi:hypothetical protein